MTKEADTRQQHIHKFFAFMAIIFGAVIGVGVSTGDVTIMSLGIGLGAGGLIYSGLEERFYRLRNTGSESNYEKIND